MWRIGQRIGDTEGRVDVCIAAAGIQLGEIDCLEYSADDFSTGMRLFPPLGQCFSSNSALTDHVGQCERRALHGTGGGQTDGPVR